MRKARRGIYILGFMLGLWPLAAVAGDPGAAIKAAVAAHVLVAGGEPPPPADAGAITAETDNVSAAPGGTSCEGASETPTEADATADGDAPAVADAVAGEASATESDAELDTEPCACEQCQTSCGTYEFFGPQAVISQHPPSLLFLSPPPDVATSLPAGARELDFRLEWTNIIIRELDSGIIADYDFETVRPSLTYKWGTPAGELSATLPFIHRGHGILDGIIADWHEWFSLPKGLRTRFPDGQYRYTIVTRRGPVFNDAGDSYGLGDLSFGFKRTLYCRDDGARALALRAGLKVPLGDADKALGSGNWDASLGVLYQRQFGARFRGYGSVDWIFVGAPDWDNIDYQDMLLTNWGLEYALRYNLTLTAQYRTQRNPLRIGSTQADKDPQELGLGFNHRVNDRLVWSGGFWEDINPETAPDFVMNTQLKWEF